MNFLDAVTADLIRAHHLKPLSVFHARDIAEGFVILITNRLEAPDSPLCDCDGAPIDMRVSHTCDCTAVLATQRLLDGFTTTLHTEQCPACQEETSWKPKQPPQPPRNSTSTTTSNYRRSSTRPPTP